MAFLKNPVDPNQPVCKNLRTKASYIPEFQDPTYWEREDPYQPYFCLKTLHNIGPDDDVVCPEACTQKRVCFAAMLQSPVP